MLVSRVAHSAEQAAHHVVKRDNTRSAALLVKRDGKRTVFFF